MTRSSNARKPVAKSVQDTCITPTAAPDSKPAAPVAPPSKQAEVLALLQRPQGATLEEMVAATGWLTHTTRAMLTGFKKKGHALESDKTDEVRRYRIICAVEVAQ